MTLLAEQVRKAREVVTSRDAREPDAAIGIEHDIKAPVVFALQALEGSKRFARGRQNMEGLIV